MSDVYGLAETIRQLEGEVGSLMTWNGKQYKCIIGARKDSAELGIGGYASDAALEIVVRAALFTTQKPAPADEVTVNGKAHKIVSVDFAPDLSVYVLTCDGAHKDA